MKQNRAQLSSLEHEIQKTWKSYTHQTTIHGLCFVGHENAVWWEKLIWSSSLILAVMAMIWMCAPLITVAPTSPTTTIVTDTYLELHKFAFPAVSVCPEHRIKKSVGEALLLRHLNRSNSDASANASLRQSLSDAMNVLEALEIPYLQNLKQPLTAAEHILHELTTLNITDFMLKAFPKCTDIFLICLWHGVPQNCCDILDLQQSTTGLCYSFNSLTSFKSRDCKTITSSANSLHTATSTISTSGAPECGLRRTTAVGKGSGLVIYLKPMPESEMLLKPVGFWMSIDHVTMFPRTTAALSIPGNKRAHLTVALSLENTVVSDGVYSLPLAKRGCVLTAERSLRVSHTYSFSDCLLECHLQSIMDSCHCVPYMFASGKLGFPDCGVKDLNCLSELGSLRPAQPPPGIDQKRALFIGAINCSHCLPTCQVMSYNTDPKLYMRSGDARVTDAGILDVYYGDLGAAKMFTRSLTFSRGRVVSSIAGLFLGLSIISVVEIVFFGIKVVAVLMQHLIGCYRMWRAATLQSVYPQQISLSKGY